MTKDVLEVLKPIFANGYGVKEVKINDELDSYNKVQIVKVYNKSKSQKEYRYTCTGEINKTIRKSPP